MGSMVTPFVGKGYLVMPITGQAAHSADLAGCLGAMINPAGATILIDTCAVYVTANSTGAANLTIGVATTIAGAHDRTDLCAATAMAAAAGTAVQGMASGDPADSLIVLAAGSYIVAFGSADTSGLVANAYIHFLST